MVWIFLIFLWFSTNFPRFSKNTLEIKESIYIEALDALVLYKTALALHKRPWERNGPCNVVIGAAQRCGRPDSDELATFLSRGSSWGGARVCQRLICAGVEVRIGRRQARPVEQGGVDHCGWNLGKGTTRLGQQAGREGRVVPRGAPGGEGRRRKRVEQRVRQQRQWQWWMRRRGACSRQKEGRATFYSQGSGRVHCLCRDGQVAQWGTGTAGASGCGRRSATGEGAGADTSFAACGAVRPPTEGGARDRGACHAPGLPRGHPMPSTSRPRGRSVRKRASVGTASHTRECQRAALARQRVDLNQSTLFDQK
jgi:hypothetical protein